MAGPLGAVRVSRRLAKEQGRHPVVFLGQRMLAWRPIALVIALVCIGVMGLAASGVTRADLTVGFVASLPPDSEPRRAGDAAARGFVPGIVAPVDVIFERPGVGRDLPALTRLQAGVARQEGIAAVLGPRETAGTALARFAVTPEGGAARLLVVLRDDPTGADGIGAYKDLRTAMPGILDAAGVEGARVSYGGETPLAEETIDAVLGDLERIAIAILVIGFVLLAIFMRSLVAPIILLFASVLAFAASLGLTALLLPHVLGGNELTYYVPLVAGVLLVSLGSDYNVFIAGSIREEARRRRLSEAIAVATPAASKAITVAGHHAGRDLRPAGDRAAAPVPRAGHAAGHRGAARRARPAPAAHPGAHLRGRAASRGGPVARSSRRRPSTSSSGWPPTAATPSRTRGG
jgi:RND superfamily putative drug exporter